MRVGITGATGFIGSLIRERLRDSGHEIVALTRAPTSGADSWQHYDLSLNAADIDLTSVEAVVHCAYQMRLKSAAHVAANSYAGAQIAAACDRQAIRLVNISSVLAVCPGLSSYATAKSSIEASVLQVGGVNLRFGVMDDFATDPGAQRIVEVARRFPRLPLPVPKGWVWLSSMDLLLDQVDESVTAPLVPASLWLARLTPITMREYVEAVLASQNLRRRCMTIPLGPTRWALEVLDSLRDTRATLSSDALGGLRLSENRRMSCEPQRLR
jgi:hypothetical protein